MSAFCAIIAPDEQVFAALEGRPFAPHGAAWDAAVAQWRGLASHPDARFDREVTVDAAEVAPMISWGTSPQQAVPITGAVPSAGEWAAANNRRALAYLAIEEGAALLGFQLDAAFIGSSTNTRFSSFLRIAPLLNLCTVPP